MKKKEVIRKFNIISCGTLFHPSGLSILSEIRRNGDANLIHYINKQPLEFSIYI